jgi:dihydrofolate reductase
LPYDRTPVKAPSHQRNHRIFDPDCRSAGTPAYGTCWNRRIAKLIYSAIASLDGYVADAKGKFDWAMPDEEVHAFVNDLERDVGTHLYGRRLYEVMKVWESDDILAGQPAVMHDYAEIWRAADKVVFSRSLGEVETSRTKLERTFAPEIVRALKESKEREISIGGPELAGQALEADLVDEIHLLLVPVAVGAGRPALPVQQQRALKLEGQRSFGNGTIYLHYRVDS